MYIAIAHFPSVPADKEQDLQEWFAWSNEQLREAEGLEGRRLLRAQDGSYIALVEHESAATFAAMHASDAVSMIHAGLGSILSNGPQATQYDVVVDFPISEGCCGGSQAASGHDAHTAQATGGCCKKS